MTSAPVIELICVGTELLDGQVNTHESYIGLRLRALGLRLARAATMPDDERALAGAIAEAFGRCDALLIAGGLGPTFDDVTREAVAAALGRRLRYEPQLYAAILRKFKRYRAPVPEENKRQAFVIEGATVLQNSFGSAPGQVIRVGRGRARAIVLMPGPFAELSPMFERQVLPRLRRWYAAGVHGSHLCVRLAGLSESAFDEKLAALTRRPGPGLRYTILAGRGQVDFHVIATAATQALAARRLNAAKRRVYAAVGDYVFGEDEATLESALGAALLDRGLTLAAAESCTGGLLGQRLTSVPGSSKYFVGGVVAYDNAVKTGLLGVSPDTIRSRGAVSAQTAREMARGARRALNASFGLAITGVAGPGGGTPQKPVGLVCVALAGPGDADCRDWTLRISGARQTVRERAAAAALDLTLRRVKTIARASV